MDGDRHIWRYWARNLQQWGVIKWVATLLEEAGPLSIIGAQIIYFTQPLFINSNARIHLDAMVRIFDDIQFQRSFVKFLREDSLL